MSAVVRNRALGLLLAAVLYVLDQGSKWFVTRKLGIAEIGDAMTLLPFFDLRYTRNYGVSLGMFEATSPEMRLVLVVLTAGIAVVVGVWLLRERLLGDIVPLAMILGGALGNIHDRAQRGYVTDFADLHFGDFRPFLIFNVADAAITIGVVIILARAFFLRDKEVDDLMHTKPADSAAETVR